VTVTAFQASDSWTLKSVGPEGETNWTEVRAGTSPATVSHDQDSEDGGYLSTGGTYDFPDRIRRDGTIIGFTTSSLPDSDEISAVTFTLRTFVVILNSTVTLEVYPITDPAATEALEWQPGATLAGLTPLSTHTMSVDPGDEILVTFTSTAAAWDAHVDRTGTTWVYVAATDLESGSYLTGGHGNFLWYDHTIGTTDYPPTLTLTHDAGAAPAVSRPAFMPVIARRRARR
jgi:hypothetical protein